MELQILLSDSYFLLIALLPVAFAVFIRSEYPKFSIDKKKATAFSFALLLLAVTPSFSFQPVYAENNINQVIKVRGTFLADITEQDYIFQPAIDVDKSIIFISFSSTTANDHGDQWRNYELVNSTAFRITGDDTATGNVVEDFSATIVEFTGTFDANAYLRTWASSESAGEKSVTISSVNTTSSALIDNSHWHGGDDTTIGAEELDRARLLTSTTAGILKDVNPNSSPEEWRFRIAEWDQGDISTQRGLATMTGTSLTISPPTDNIVRDQTMLLVSYTTTAGAFTEQPDDIGLRATIDTSSPPNIVMTRTDGSATDLDIAWEIIQFPSDYAKVYHETATLSGGTFVVQDQIAGNVTDYSKSFAMSTVSVPYGFSSGQSTDTGAGTIDSMMADITLIDNDLVEIERGDSTGTFTLDYQVIEFLEEKFTQPATGTNEIRQVQELEGSAITGELFTDFTISPPLLNVNKTIAFVSIRESQSEQIPEVVKSWNIFNTTTFRVHATPDPEFIPDAVELVIYLVEFTPSSPIFVQRDTMHYPSNIFDDPKEMAMSAVNTTNSFITLDGFSMTGEEDPTIGREELQRIRILNETQWEWEVDTPQESTTLSLSTFVRASIHDFNDDRFLVQRGQTTFSGTSLAVSPITDIDRDRTILLTTYKSTSDVFAQIPANSSLTASISTDSPPDIIFEREVADADLEINWELVSFPDELVDVQHGFINQTGGTLNNTSTITAVGNITNAIVVGTVGTPFGYGHGKGSSTVASGFNATLATLKIEDTTTVRGVRDDSTGTFDMAFQVIEFLTGQIFNQTVTDMVTASPEDLIFNINKTAVDFSTSVDLETNNNITKLGTDIASTGDTISADAVFVVNLSDTGEAIDVLHINMTKLSQETVGITDDPDFTIDKLLSDIVQVNDTVNVATIFGVEILDTATVDDMVILNITKQFSDVTGQIDDLNIEATKVFLDTTSIVDFTNATIDTGVNQTDTVLNMDTVVLNITKLIDDVVSTSDTVVVGTVIDLALNDTVVVNDPSIKFIVSSVVPNGTGTGGTGGGGLPTFQRLVGLNIISELFHVEPSDVVPSDFIIETFGRETSTTSIISIVPEQAFVEWFDFSSFPDPLNYETTVDNSRTINDPARFKNSALDDFVLNIPRLACSEVDPFATPVPCVDPIVYEADLIFTFKKGGVEFKEKHTVTIDATTPIVCDPICQFVEFITVNYWWLAGILIMFMILYFVGTGVRNRGIRTVRRVNAKHFNSFEAKPKTKFKKGKR